MADIDNDMVSKHIQYCKHCGKEIDADSLYCRYCGNKQDKTISLPLTKFSLLNKESWRKLLRVLLKWIIVAVACFGIGCLGMFICYLIGGEDSVCSNALKGYGYILPPFIAYLIFKILSFTYSLKGKKKTMIAILLAILTAAFLGWLIYAEITYTEREKQEYKSSTTDAINRTFLGCTFGESYATVEKTLNQRGLNPQNKVSKNGNKQWFITNTRYGKFDVDTIFFTFFQDKLFDVYISINTLDIDDYRNNYTYKSLSDLLEDKYRYKKNLSHKYRNSQMYSDEDTEILLWHKANGDGYEKYCVSIDYYDKTSGYKEERDKDF